MQVVFPAWGVSADQLLKTIKRLTEGLPADIKFIPGHGRVCSLDDLKASYRTAVGKYEIFSLPAPLDSLPFRCV